MHNIKTNFDKILGAIKDILSNEINENGNYRKLNFCPVSFLVLCMLKISLNIELQRFFEKQNETGLMP
jgi:hypothetical protein